MLFSAVKDYFSALSDFNAIASDRKKILDPLATYIRERLDSGEAVNLVFICTHNSRRSHFGQIWAQIAAFYYDVGPVNCYSGGTEVTACNPRTVSALQRAGIDVQAITGGDNPVYLLKYAEGVNPAVAFSKTWDQAPNPSDHFAAIMTCSHAEENCPFIPGAEKRFSITYDDPKSSDGTSLESAVYDERCREIARETAYVFYCVKTR